MTSAGQPGRLPRSLLLAALSSGAAALVFETLWARSLAIALGSTVHANALVFAAFMAGLAVGAFGFGRLAERTRRVTRLYAWIEIAIGISGLAVGLLLHLRASDLARLVGPLDDGAGLASAVGLALALVGLPTSLMGATFPLLLESARQLRGELVHLYGVYAINTLGAALGTLATTLVAIPQLGISRSLLLAATFNWLAAALVWRLEVQPAPSAPAAAVAESAPGSPADVPTDGAEGDATPAGEDGGRGDPALLVSAFASGLVVLALEVVWSRLASFFLGNRTLAFTVLVAWVLGLLAAGSWLASKLGPRARRDPDRWFGWLWLVSAALVVACSFGAHLWVGEQARVEGWLPRAGGLLLVYRVVETGILLGPMMLALGCIFPMSLLCSPAVGGRTGSTGGRFYLVNTVGAVLGSLVTGFYGVTTLGTFAWTAIIVALSCAVALSFFVRALWRRRSARQLWGLAAMALVLPADQLLASIELGAHVGEGELLMRREDAYGVFRVVRGVGGDLAVFNNRTELVYRLGRVETSFVQQMQGHLGMMYHPRARRALVLGSGYGITAGALGLYPTLERVDAVEIVPAMVEAAPLFSPFNLDYHHNPKVRVVVDDGRHFLARSSESWDIISVNVSDAHLPGASSLFHRDFYQVAKEHLASDGVLIQHAFGIDVAIVAATLRASFAHLVFTRAYGNGFNVVASDRPLQLDEEAAEELLHAPAVRGALRGIGLIEPVDLPAMLQHRVDFTIPGIDRAELATDDRPVLELSWSGGAALWLFANE